MIMRLRDNVLTRSLIKIRSRLRSVKLIVRKLSTVVAIERTVGLVTLG